jgi:hypothetical protein
MCIFCFLILLFSSLFYVRGPSWSRSYGSWILQLPMQLVPITTNVVSSNPVTVEYICFLSGIGKRKVRQICSTIYTGLL